MHSNRNTLKNGNDANSSYYKDMSSAAPEHNPSLANTTQWTCAKNRTPQLTWTGRAWTCLWWRGGAVSCGRGWCL